MGSLLNSKAPKLVHLDVEQPLCFLGRGGRDFLLRRRRAHGSNLPLNFQNQVYPARCWFAT
jgi:hypothetical protein